MIYAIITSIQEAKLGHLSDCHMILLSSFIISHHPKIKTLVELTNAQQEHISDSVNYIHLFNDRLNHYQNSGELPLQQSFGKSGLLENLIVWMCGAPVMGTITVLFDIDEARKYKHYRIIHTELRKNWFSKTSILLFSNLFFLFIILLLIIRNPSWWKYLLFSIVSISVVACIIDIAMFVWQQMAWKGFWGERFLDLMAIAEKKHDHDLFNRAMILKSYVESQPDIPVPGNLGFYVVIYSGVQALLLLIAKYISA
jgi:hypothetical protein